MKFLGDLGIDLKLLIAQIINFGLLLWLLTKFLYKPVIRRIEDDEAELKQAQTRKEELDREKNDFAQQKKKEITEARKQVREIIEEAEDIAKKIKKEAQVRIDKDAVVMMKQSKDKIRLLEPEIREKIIKDIRPEISDSFQKSFSSALPTPLRKKFQDIFWLNFIGLVEAVPLQELSESDLVKALEKSDLAAEKKATDKSVLKEELEKVIDRKIGRLVLEYAFNLTREQENKIKKIISKKIGLKLDIIKRQNRNLISGFRLEISGMIIESNLLSIINNATNLKK